MKERSWYELNSAKTSISPSLLVYPSRIAHNITQMLQIAGGAARLRPHVKTYKMAEIIRMQMEQGIKKFKCATIAEAELLGICKAADVLLAIQPVGPNIDRFMALQLAFPETTFSTIVDEAHIALQLHDRAIKRNRKTAVYMDVDVGMHRTGIPTGTRGLELYRKLCSLSHLEVRGFHVYDGHIRDSRLEDRTKACNEAFEPVLEMKRHLEKEGMKVPVIVAGGSPTFPIHAGRTHDVETSPGTTLLWDARYADDFTDMPFLPAAVLLSRIISKPGDSLLCLDLGHKAVAPEMPFPRVQFLGLDDFEQLSQSEEHLVLRTPSAHTYELGMPCYALPMHICPTVAKYPVVYIVESGEITDSWRIIARDHQLTI